MKKYFDMYTYNFFLCGFDIEFLAMSRPFVSHVNDTESLAF